MLNKNLVFQKPRGSFSSQFPENFDCLELEIYMVSIVAPDIAAALKIKVSWKRMDFWHPIL
jgi:hypothetical protein